MLISDFDYELPSELIAQQPLDQRDASRLMIVDRERQAFSDHAFHELPSFLKSRDVLVLNNTKVFPARLIGRSETGARVEIFLIEELGPTTWKALAKPAKRLAPGKRIAFGEKLTAQVIEK